MKMQIMKPVTVIYILTAYFDRIKSEVEKRKIGYDKLFEKYIFYFLEKLINIAIREQVKFLLDYTYIDDDMRMLYLPFS